MCLRRLYHHSVSSRPGPCVCLDVLPHQPPPSRQNTKGKPFGFLFIISRYQKLFSDIGNSNSRYREIIPDIGKWFPDIGNSNFGYRELFSDIGNSISQYPEIIPDIEKWISFPISRNDFPISGNHSRYREIDHFPISEIDFPISGIPIPDIGK